MNLMPHMDAHNGSCATFGARADESSVSGFTLLEIMVVLAIFVILMTLAAGSYERSVLHAKEAALHQDLAEMRKAIDDYTMDKAAAPNTLDDLVQAQYLHEVPVDPLTGKREWTTDTCDELLSPDQTSTGICNVHSESDGVSPLENSAYSSW
ncbi:MAG TPA: type II secretion system protein [Candidatus Acidoferrales bacterium]|nr:type II secretion system protein [Candidatus Acidoferrales bacterium]